jgi:hypothetical protein
MLCKTGDHCLRLPFGIKWDDVPETSSEVSGDESGRAQTVLVQCPDRKMMSIGMAEGATVHSLYRKVASLLNRTIESFVLDLPMKRLKNNEELVSKTIPAESIVRLFDA